MEIIILILLCVVIVCLIVLLMQNKSKEVETSSADSLILQKNFEYLLKQVQDVQKNQATSKSELESNGRVFISYEYGHDKYKT